MNIFNLDQPNNKIILKNSLPQSKKKESTNNNNKQNNLVNNLKNHWFNQKFEIILPINGTTNNDPIEKLKKSKGSLLSKKSLTGKLLVESEFTQLFQQHNESTLPIVDDQDTQATQDSQQQSETQMMDETSSGNDLNDDANVDDNNDADQDTEIQVESGDIASQNNNSNNNNNNNNNNNTQNNNRNKNNRNKNNRNKINNINNDKSSYYKIETTLDLILSQEFLSKYIRAGGFHAISQFSFIDSGNVFAILPNGKIILNVNKETYQDLGLVGKASVFKSTERYIITLDSNSKELSANSKYYNRLMWVLKDRLSPITLICYYQKDYIKESKESSVIYPIKFPKGVKVKRMFNNALQSIEKHRIPTLEIINQYLNVDLSQKNQQIAVNTASKESKLLLADFVNEFIEMLGLITTESELFSDPENDYQLSNSLLSSTTLPTEIFRASLNGFVSNSLIIETISKIKTLIKNGTIEYGCLIIHGFADTPVSWGSIEHNYLFGGENDQCILILPNNQYLNLNLIGTLDYYC